MNEIITPHNYLEYVLSSRKNKPDPAEMPSCIIASWDPSFIKKLAAETGQRPAAYSPWGSSVFSGGKTRPGLMTLPVGAPHSVINLELMVAAGVKTVITVGICGTLRKDLSAGDIIIPDRCIREEGTSPHYVRDDALIVPDRNLSDRIGSIFREENIPFTTGGTWTIDAFFRETKEKRDRYAEEGIIAVEMECSAVFAFGVFRKIRTCSVLIVSDNLSGEWKPEFASDRIKDSFGKTGKALIEKMTEFE
jgi:uridine phosphorylase